MTPFVLDYSMAYARPNSSLVFSDAHSLAQETVDGEF